MSYDFNTSGRLNALLIDLFMDTGQLKCGVKYDMDFDHGFIETEKYDAKTYKHFKNYSPGVAVIGDKIMGIENRDGNANVRFHQADTLELNRYAWYRYSAIVTIISSIYQAITLTNIYAYYITYLEFLSN